MMCCKVFNVWPKTTVLLPVWPRDATRLDIPWKDNLFKVKDMMLRLAQAASKNNVWWTLWDMKFISHMCGLH